MAYAIAGYLALVFFVARRGASVKSFGDFVLSRGRLRAAVLGVSFAATYASVSLFMGVSGWAYSWGASTLWYQGALWLGTVAALFLAAPRYHRLGVEHGSLSLAELLGSFYGSAFLRRSIALLTAFNVFYIAGQYVGIATLLESFLGLPYRYGVVGAASITALWTAFGGTYFNVRSDFLQGLAMVGLAALIVSGVALESPGGLAALPSALAAEGPALASAFNPASSTAHSALSVLAVSWLLLIFTASPHLAQTVLSVGKAAELRRFAAVASLCLLPIVLVPLSGLAARAMGLQAAKADAAMPVFFAAVFPSWLSGFLAVGLVAAALTTVNNLYVSISAALAGLIPTGSRSPEAADRRRLAAGRLLVPISAAAAAALALARPASLTVLIWIGINGILSGVSGPLVGALFLKRRPRVAAVASFAVGLAVYLALYPRLVPNVFLSGSAASLAGLAVMLVWRGEE